MRREIPEAWRVPVEDYLAYLGAMGYSASTVASRRSRFRRFASEIAHSPEAVTTKDLIRVLAQCPSREYKKSVKNAFSSFFRWYCNIEHGRDDNPADMLPAIRKPQPAPRPCPDISIRAALEKATAAERLMILLAAECGLRRAEIAQVHSVDVVADSSGHRSLIVHGKGDKQRIVPLPDDMAAAILAADGYVFPGRYGGHVEASYIGRHISRLLPRGYSAHKLRHRFATTAYARSHDMLGVAKALGHASTETTMAYTALPDEALRDLVSAAMMTRQPDAADDVPADSDAGAAPMPEPLPSVRPVERLEEQVRRHANGKVRYRYEGTRGSRRETATDSPEALRAALILAGEIGHGLQSAGRRSFSIPAEACAERYQIAAEGHTRRGSVLRAGARLLQEHGLIELRSSKDGTITGNVTTGAEQLRAAMDDYAREWMNRQR